MDANEKRGSEVLGAEMRVVTYQRAYVAGSTSLCETCEVDPEAREALPTLGPVAHGLHRGTCDWCQVRRPERDRVARVTERAVELAGKGAGYSPDHQGPEGTDSTASRTGWVWVPKRTPRQTGYARDAGLETTPEGLERALLAAGVEV